jgi:hypothetical protein
MFKFLWLSASSFAGSLHSFVSFLEVSLLFEFVDCLGRTPINSESCESFEPFAESCRIVRYSSILLLEYLILNLA